MLTLLFLDRLTLTLHAEPDAGTGGGGAGGGAGAGSGGAGGGATPETVPYHIFQKAVEAKNNATGRIAELEASVQKLTEKAATVDTVSAQLTETKAEVAKEKSRFATFTEFSAALGTTDTDTIEVFDTKYRALPEADRPTRKAWVDTLKAKADEAPAVLRPWLTPAATTTTTTTTKPQPKPVGGTDQPAGTVNPPDMAKVRELRIKASKSGNWDEYKAYAKAHGIRK